jgi:polyferredoxin
MYAVINAVHEKKDTKIKNKNRRRMCAVRYRLSKGACIPVQI